MKSSPMRGAVLVFLSLTGLISTPAFAHALVNAPESSGQADHYYNFRSGREKYFVSPNSATSAGFSTGPYWYYILPGGFLYQYTAPIDGSLHGNSLGTVGPAIYDNPSLLWILKNPYTLSSDYYVNFRGQNEKYLKS